MNELLLDTAVHDSVVRFDASQRALFADESRIILAIFHRQKGKDFVTAGKCVDEGCKGGQDWWIGATTQGQADETFLKAKKFVDAMKGLLKKKFGSDEIGVETESFVDWDREIDQKFTCTNRILRLPNGVRICSLPGRDPDAWAGRTGNIVMTEFALFPHGGYKHWDVIYPITTRNGSYFIMITTPRGKNTKAYEVFRNADNLYSVHVCNIYKSVHEEGYQLYAPKPIAGTYRDASGRYPFYQRTREEQDYALATFRKIYNSEGKWKREYECEFTGDLSALVPWNQLERAAELGAGLPFDYLRVNDEGMPLGEIWAHLKSEAEHGVKIEIGWDVARTSNLSAVMVNFNRGLAHPKHLRFALAMRNLPFANQRAFVQACMDLNGWRTGAGDATGLGRESNETLEGHYPKLWIPFQFTSSSVREIGSSLSTAFVDGNQTLPALDDKTKFIATDIYAIQKDDSGTNFTLEATPNPLLEESHCDLGYAMGLSRVAGARNNDPPRPFVKIEAPAHLRAAITRSGITGRIKDGTMCVRSAA